MKFLCIWQWSLQNLVTDQVGIHSGKRFSVKLQDWSFSQNLTSLPSLCLLLCLSLFFSSSNFNLSFQNGQRKGVWVWLICAPPRRMGLCRQHFQWGDFCWVGLKERFWYFNGKFSLRLWDEIPSHLVYFCANRGLWVAFWSECYEYAKLKQIFLGTVFFELQTWNRHWFSLTFLVVDVT